MNHLRSSNPQLLVKSLATASLLTCFFSASLLLSACSQKPDDQATNVEASAPKKRELPRVRTQPVEQREMRRVLVTATAIESVLEVDVTPKIGGLVTEVLVEEGMAVSAGQVLVVLDDREANAALEEARIALREAKETLPGLSLTVSERAEAVQRALLTHSQAEGEVKRHEQTGLISENELSKLRLSRDQAQRDLVSAKLSQQSAELSRDSGGTAVDKANLSVNRRELELSYTRVSAPFDGVIAMRTVREGRNVGAAESLMTLTDPNNLRAVIYRPQRELALFQSRADQLHIEARPDALPDESYAGHLTIVSPTIDSSSGSIRLSINLEQPPVGDATPRLLPGMLVRLHIVVDRHPDALVVRKRALRREGDRRYLFVVREGIAQQVAVEEGFEEDLFVEVLPLGDDVLAAGEEVITVGNREIEAGTGVRVEENQSQEDDSADTATAETASDEGS
jgi:RND family efflux transporter MFP subunit